MVEHRHITIPYAPRRAFLPFHNRTQRWASLVVHRRAGKTVSSVNDLIKAALSNQRAWPPPRYAYIGPYYNQAKRIAWGYVRHYSDCVPNRNPVESDPKVMVFPNGAELRVLGADNPDSLRGDYLDGVVCDEFADWAPSVFPLVVRPMLSDYRGWATFIGTPKGHNAFHDQHMRAEKDPDNWFTMTLRASESALIPAEELADAKSGMTDEQYEQEYECSFEAAILGAYFGREMAEANRSGRVGDVPYDPDLPCHTAWDLGKGANMPVWIWQPTYSGINMIDYVEGVHSDGIPQVLRKTRDLGYPIENDYVPEDALILGTGSGRTRIEQLKLNGGNPKVVMGQKIDDRISAAKLTIPLTRFDKLRCKDGIEALTQYKADYDEVLRTFRDIPKKDWASHPSDAYQVAARAWRAMERPAGPPPEERKLHIGSKNTITLNDLAGRLGERRRDHERL